MASNYHPTYFRFVHDKSYQIAHSNFLNAAQRGYSEAIMQNLSIFPTHVESLLQLSDMIRVSEDYKTASDFVERCILIFERGFHQRFNLASANCRLSYKRPENRTFFITIFKHIMYCNRRGLRRTPLEYSKLLLALDPITDPLFTVLLMDFYSIRSEEYDYLIEFISKWQHLSKLPNMKFSLALAHFMKSRSSKRGKAASDDSSNLADEYLQEALLNYPNFIIPLLEVCNAEPDSELKKCTYFDYSVYSNKYKTVPEAVDLLVNIYVQRNSNIWKAKNVMAWLEKNIAILVERFTKKELVDTNQQVEYWSSFRGPSPRNLLRHVVLSDLKVKLPPSATTSTVLDIDPFPPTDSIISYSREVVIPTTSSSNLDAPSIGFPGLFIRSILPSFSLTSGEHSASEDHAQNFDQLASEVEVQQQLLEEQVASAIMDDVEARGEETGINLDRVQSSIQNVLSSLTNLLIGAEARTASENEGDQENDDHQD